MSSTKDGSLVTFKYFTLPPGYLGRGGVVELFMTYHGIQFQEVRLAFPWESPQIKKELVASGESLAGTLPVVTLEEQQQHLCGHIPIMRYFEQKVGVCTSDAIQEFRLDELADEYSSWRDAWASTLGGDAASITNYTASRAGFYNLMEAFYARQSGNSPFYLGGESPRYADFAVFGIMSDDQIVYGTWDYGRHPSLAALWTSFRKVPVLGKFFT